MIKKEFYKMRLVAGGKRLEIQTEVYVAIHETNCYWFAVAESGYKLAFNPDTIRSMHKNETLTRFAKRKNLKVHRIAKSGSRFAFETPQAAYLHLRYIKQLQLKNLERKKNLIDEFLLLPLIVSMIN